MYTIQEFNQLKAANDALNCTIDNLKAEIESLKREQRKRDVDVRQYEKFYKKRRDNAISFMQSGALTFIQISVLTGFSHDQLQQIKTECNI